MLVYDALALGSWNGCSPADPGNAVPMVDPQLLLSHPMIHPLCLVFWSASLSSDSPAAKRQAAGSKLRGEIKIGVTSDAAILLL